MLNRYIMEYGLAVAFSGSSHGQGFAYTLCGGRVVFARASNACARCGGGGRRRGPLRKRRGGFSCPKDTRHYK